MSTIRVRAIGDALLPKPGFPGRFVARNPDRSIIAEGVDVPDDSYHRRAIRRGELEEVSS